MTYWPPGLTRGLAITGMTVLAWFGLAFRLVRAGRGRPAVAAEGEAAHSLGSPHWNRDREPIAANFDDRAHSLGSESFAAPRHGGQR
jgi:hypothetical protein